MGGCRGAAVTGASRRAEHRGPGLSLAPGRHPLPLSRHARCHHGCTACCPRVSARVLSVQCCDQLHCCTHSTHLASDVRVPVPHVPWQRGRWNLGVEWGFVWEGAGLGAVGGGATGQGGHSAPSKMHGSGCHWPGCARGRKGRSWRSPSPRPSPSLLSWLRARAGEGAVCTAWPRRWVCFLTSWGDLGIPSPETPGEGEHSRLGSFPWMGALSRW